jgi:hypothetical protein
LPPRQDAFDEKEIRHLIDLLDNAERCLSPWPIRKRLEFCKIGIAFVIREGACFEIKSEMGC